MINVFKCCGPRMLRGPVSVPGGACSLESPSYGMGQFPVVAADNLNWSQKRFIRGQSTPGGSEKENKECKQTEGDNLEKNVGGGGEVESGSNQRLDNLQSLPKQNKLLKYCRSVRGFQTHFLESLPKSEENEVYVKEMLIAEISKLVVESGTETIRIKNRKDENLVKEWIGIQNELRVVKNDRVEEDRRKLEIAGQQVLREMARLTKAINLDELDQAIEGALCSQAKRDYSHSQQKSSHDN